MTTRRTCHLIPPTVIVVMVFLARMVSAFAQDTVRIGSDLDRPRSLAVSANGQTVVTIAGRDHAILAGDPSDQEPWREVVSAAGEGNPMPVAVGCLLGDVVGTVCRDGDAWSLRTFRTGPSSSADSATPLQVVRLGRAPGVADDVAFAVHHSRGWLVVTGLPSPLPPVVRCAIAGVRVGPPSDRTCPQLPEGHRPVAVATNRAGDIVLVLRTDSGDDVLAIYDAAGRELLRLPAGLKKVAAIAVGRGDDLMWAVGGSENGQTGLWRLDAAFRDRRQVVLPVLVHPLVAPTAVVSVSDRAIVVIDGKPQPNLVRIRPPALEASSSGRSLP